MSDVDLVESYAEEVWNQGKHELIDELFANGHQYHDPLLPDLPSGPEGVHQRVITYMSAFPDAKVTLDDLFASGDKVLLRWTWGGTNTGEVMGISATGKPATTTGMHLCKCSGGKIRETWVQYDALGLLQQIGLATVGPPS
ncbi:MAG: ester cyclase [Thermoleophilia bacterium]|nr:ester cyclase [Thermoleophilia bacterium]MDH3725256.1 ester cyclase [Thermoleophilia bacterium]